jgi:uncharacterized membrane protein
MTTDPSPRAPSGTDFSGAVAGRVAAIVRALWSRGILGTFAAGMFVILPLVLTIAIISWIGSWVVGLIGPGSALGAALRNLGLWYVADPNVAEVIGWVLVLIGIWGLGVLVKSTTRTQIAGSFDSVMGRIPLVRTVYRPVSQVVSLLQRNGDADVKSMSVVYCWFGEERSGGFLALLVSPRRFRMGEGDCHLVYIPTTPLPMSGGLVFVPEEKTRPVAMSVDDLMKIYLSLGVLADKVIPEGCTVGTSAPTS